MTRDPPENLVGVTLASSAPCAVSNTSLDTLIASCMNDAPMTVRTAVSRSNAPCRAAIRIPRSTGTIVALRNGRRVVRNTSDPIESRGLTGVPRSTESASKYFRD